MAAIQKAAEAGTSYGAPTEMETRLARLVQAAFPSVERMRFVSSGTEACMSALRVARGFTGRNGIVKFEGCYHGHVDSLLVKAGSGAPDLRRAGQPGRARPTLARHTLTLPYNDLEAVRELFAARASEIAAVIVEPVAGNMGVVPPRPGFLEGLREITRRHGALLILDEVITGFRVARGGAQELFGITPDLTCLGKIVGGGLPVGVYGGRVEIMEKVAPLGSIYQAGTLSGNPLAMAAGAETLTLLQAPGVYADLEAKGEQLARGLAEAAAACRLPPSGQPGRVHVDRVLHGRAGARLRLGETGGCQACTGLFFRAMLDRGVSLAPSQFEAAFVSLAHTTEDLEATIAAARESSGRCGGFPVNTRPKPSV